MSIGTSKAVLQHVTPCNPCASCNTLVTQQNAISKLLGRLGLILWTFWKARRDHLSTILLVFQSQLEKPANDEDYEDEDEDDEGFGGGAKKIEEVEEDPLEGNR